MRKVILTMFILVIVLTFDDYYNAFIGATTKEIAIVSIDARITTLIMVLFVLFLFRKNIYYKNDECSKGED